MEIRPGADVRRRASCKTIFRFACGERRLTRLRQFYKMKSKAPGERRRTHAVFRIRMPPFPRLSRFLWERHHDRLPNYRTRLRSFLLKLIRPAPRTTPSATQRRRSDPHPPLPRVSPAEEGRPPKRAVQRTRGGPRQDRYHHRE